jgi:hypothetical protein
MQARVIGGGVTGNLAGTRPVQMLRRTEWAGTCGVGKEGDNKAAGMFKEWGVCMVLGYEAGGTDRSQARN